MGRNQAPVSPHVQGEPGRLRRSPGSTDPRSQHFHHGQGKVSDIPYELKHNEVVSTEPILSRDAKTLVEFLRLHGRIPPDFFVDIKGTHIERHTQTITYSNGTTQTQVHNVTIVDFSFSIDLLDIFISGEEPIFYTLGDDVPAYRGGMHMSVEMEGPKPFNERTEVNRSVYSAQKEALNIARQLGLPPWIAVAGMQARDVEASVGTPQASSRTLEEWAEDYIRTKRTMKEFKLSKEIYAWDIQALTTSLEYLIRSTGYRTDILIQFKTKPECVHVYSSGIISKIFSSYLLIFLTSITLIFPFLWLWRRLWPDAGGKWEVGGAAFRAKRWELVPGTRPGETEYNALVRLGGPQGVGGRRLRAGKEGVWVLKGVHEADWFKEWEDSIRCGVNERLKTHWLPKRMIGAQQLMVNAITAGLNRI
ncbi:hypothetical protein M408DRAFT_75641 [Serendipita vermifera MAFF 305830]|uniref:Uncharacterized protein n=1 Tax=Serendipita vermifera MAFF 305830 TaxID=933852 RepID=A0A0C2WDX6_SERVB|nr:hypothetical protein M408DRAFT_75641 [Serendipita vermifera MAFF 305830]